MNLTQFKKNPEGFTFHLKFSDGFEADLSSQQLRDNCPCASCKGEEVLLHKYEPLDKNTVTPSGYKLEKAEPVGNYAIKLTWKDGHDTGIYSWGYLRKIIENQFTDKHKTE
ncbi:MAG: DUF971 domain-containing protein [Ignavibacteria bacterium]|jgi:DUF971 family protein